MDCPPPVGSLVSSRLLTWKFLHSFIVVVHGYWLGLSTADVTAFGALDGQAALYFVFDREDCLVWCAAGKRAIEVLFSMNDGGFILI